MRKDHNTVTATEIANWVYCPESFRLAALGHRSANQAVRDHGTAHHRWKAIAERIAATIIALGRILIILALLALLAAFLWR